MHAREHGMGPCCARWTGHSIPAASPNPPAPEAPPLRSLGSSEVMRHLSGGFPEGFSSLPESLSADDAPHAPERHPPELCPDPSAPAAASHHEGAAPERPHGSGQLPEDRSSTREPQQGMRDQQQQQQQPPDEDEEEELMQMSALCPLDDALLPITAAGLRSKQVR